MLGRSPHLHGAAALRARDVPLGRRERLLRTHPGKLLSVGRAAVEPLAHRGLGGRHDDAGDVEPFGDDDLVDQGGRDHVYVAEPREVGEVVLVGGEVVNRVHPAQQVGEQVPVADVALVEVDLGTQVGRLAAVPVHWLGERVQHNDVMSEASSRSQVCEPMKPAPPVTRIFISCAAFRFAATSR